MKRYLPISIFCSLLFLFSGVHGQHHDDAMRGQMKRINSSNWNDWQYDPTTNWLGLPRNAEGWFFWRVLNTKYYNGKDRRTLSPKGPYTQHIAGATLQINQETDIMNYADSMKTIKEKEYVNMSGGAGDIIYFTFFQNVFQDFRDEGVKIWNRASDKTKASSPGKEVKSYFDLKTSLVDEKIAAIHDSYMQRGSRMIQYVKLEDEYKKIMSSYNLAIQSINNYFLINK